MNAKQLQEQTCQYNILTSSDNTLAPQMAVSLTAIAKNLAHAHIDLYLLHSQISPGNIKLLTDLCNGYGNITFHEIIVPDPENYDPLVRAGRWYRETYYPLCAHQLLPDTIDRILYLDAGDTLVVEDIAPYYNCDFENNFLIVTPQKYKPNGEHFVLYSPDDLLPEKGYLPGILEGIFNSGSYMINLKKMRNAMVDIAYYHDLTEQLRINIKKSDNGEEDPVYFGDQGLLSAAFIGRMKYFGYPQISYVWYNPYNFCIGYYQYVEQKPDYQPAILHFAGVPFKPWKAEYPIFPERFQRNGGDLQSLSKLKPQQVEYYLLWLEYLFLTDKVLSLLGY